MSVHSQLTLDIYTWPQLPTQKWSPFLSDLYNCIQDMSRLKPAPRHRKRKSRSPLRVWCNGRSGNSGERGWTLQRQAGNGGIEGYRAKQDRQVGQILKDRQPLKIVYFARFCSRSGNKCFFWWPNRLVNWTITLMAGPIFCTFPKAPWGIPSESFNTVLPQPYKLASL